MTQRYTFRTMFEARDFLRHLGHCDTAIACCSAGFVVRLTRR